MHRAFKILPAAAAVTALTLSVSQAREFRSADVQVMDYPTVKTQQYMGKLVSEKLGGKYTIKVYGNSTLGPEGDTVEQVKIGAIDMARVGSSYFHTIVPESMILSFPFLFRDMEHHRKVIYGPIGERILAKFEPTGFVGLIWEESGARGIYAKKPVRTLADVKGMKIRMQPSDLMIGLAKAMGANPTPMPFGEIYTGLKTGLVDAAENNYPSYETQKHYEAAPFYNETMHVMTPEVVIFSKRIWDTLSADEHKAFREAAKEAIPYYVDLWTAKEKESKAIVEKAGVKIITDINRQEFVEAEKPVWDKFATTPEMKQLVIDILNTK